MRPPKTPTDFDYVLWTTEDGRYMVRVKSTGEETEVDKETIRFLRAEEHRARDYATKFDSDKLQDAVSLSDLYTDDPSKEMDTSKMLADPTDFTQDIITATVEQEFLALLTSSQMDIYKEVLKNGVKPSAYAKALGISPSVITRQIQAIQKRAKIFFKNF